MYGSEKDQKTHSKHDTWILQIVGVDVYFHTDGSGQRSNLMLDPCNQLVPPMYKATVSQTLNFKYQTRSWAIYRV